MKQIPKVQACQTVKKPRAFAISLGLLPGTGYRLSDSQALDSSFFTVWCDATAVVNDFLLPDTKKISLVFDIR